MKKRPKSHPGYDEWLAGDYESALPLIQQSADSGDAEARTKLGQMYKLGQGVQKCEQAAVMHFKTAAGQGDSGGQYLYAMALEAGAGTSRDPHEALHWHLRAMKQGNRLAPGRVLALLRDQPEWKSVCEKLNIFPAIIDPDGTEHRLV